MVTTLLTGRDLYVCNVRVFVTNLLPYLDSQARLILGAAHTPSSSLHRAKRAVSALKELHKGVMGAPVYLPSVYEVAEVKVRRLTSEVKWATPATCLQRWKGDLAGAARRSRK